MILCKSTFFSELETSAQSIARRITQNPVHSWNAAQTEELFGVQAQVHLKLELFQHTGSFKLRGALSVLDRLSPEQRERGVVAGTGGNHGIAVAYAAQQVGSTAHIIVPKTINPFRLAEIERWGARISYVDSLSEILDVMNEVAAKEGRFAMHPFEHPHITLGTGTLGLEFLQQVSDLDVLIVPIGGGGLASGVSSAVKQVKPTCTVYGVEPAGANSMYQSRTQGKPVSLTKKPWSIADSLCAPRCEPYSFSLCERHLEDIVLVSDAELRSAMNILYRSMKLVVEPAGAAATAALLGPLRKHCAGRSVGIVVCGSNIDITTFSELITLPAYKQK